MKARIVRLTAILTTGMMLMATPGISAEASVLTAGVTSGISKNIAVSTETSADTQTADTQQTAEGTVSAGITSALSVCIDTSTHSATVTAAENATTAASEAQATVAGYTNLGIARVEGNLNVRDGANEGANLVGKMPNNAGCEILGTDGEWTQIKSGDVTGYVKTQYLITGEEARTYAQSIMSTVATVTADTLYVREQPNTDCEIIAMMPTGEEVQVIENQGDWIKVAVDSDEGYISAQYVTLATELPKAMNMTQVKYGEGVSDVKVDLVDYATQFVGNPYVWGGTSLTRGADCSGFTMSIFAKYGVSLPHSSRAQANAGTRVKASEAQPGDLFFYGSGKSISHVAIYIGNGQIVHASNRRTGIKISNAFYRSPICVVRLLK